VRVNTLLLLTVMSRARGKAQSKSTVSKKRHPQQGNLLSIPGPNGDKDLHFRLNSGGYIVWDIPHYDSTFNYVRDCSHIYKYANRERLLFDTRSHWYRFQSSLVSQRPRTSGRVGPELDTSVVNSNIRFDMLKHIIPGGKNAFHLFPRPPPEIDHHEPMDTNHGCVQTCFMGLENVKRWTRFAYELGIEFEGRFNYRLPRERRNANHSLSFLQKKLIGMIPTHRRSEPSKIIRAARRGKKSACEIKQTEVPLLFQRKYALSAKKMRQVWWSLKPYERTKFSSFKVCCETNICLYPKRCRSTIPGIVYSALRRIYSNPKIERNYWFDHDKPVRDLKYILQVNKPISRHTLPVLNEKHRLIRRQPVPGVPSILNTTVPLISQDEWSFGEPNTHHYMGSSTIHPRGFKGFKSFGQPGSWLFD
jgi:hypothetical protein